MNRHSRFAGIGVAVITAGLLTAPAIGQFTATPAHPPIFHQDPNQSQVGLLCPTTAKASGNEPVPAGWSIYAGTFSLPLYSAAVMSNDAASDRLLCLYGGSVQLSLARIVPKGTCTVNAGKTGFICK